MLGEAQYFGGEGGGGDGGGGLSPRRRSVQSPDTVVSQLSFSLPMHRFVGRSGFRCHRVGALNPMSSFFFFVGVVLAARNAGDELVGGGALGGWGLIVLVRLHIGPCENLMVDILVWFVDYLHMDS